MDRFSDRTDVDAAAVLTRIGEVSPYFRLEIDEGSAPLAEFYADDDAIRSAVRRVGLAMGTEEFRTAASTFHIGVVARLWSITLGAMVLTGTRVVLDPARIFYSPTSTGITLSTEFPQVEALDLRARAADGTISGAAATGAAHALQDGHLGALAAGLGRAGSIARPMLRGNTVATVFGAGRMIDRHLGRSAPPEFTGPALPEPVLPAARGPGWRSALITAASEPLAGAAEFDAAGGYRRRSCCLYYRVPGGGLCGDCVLDTVPGD